MLRLGIVAHPKKSKSKAVTRKILKEAKGIKGLDIVLSEATAGLIDSKEIDVKPLNQIRTDAIMCIGGDGTILRVLRESDCPVIGINAGSLGFLTEVQPEDTKDALLRIHNGRYTIEERTKICPVLNGKKLDEVTNEVVLTTEIPSKIQNYHLNINMVTSERIRADGILISTPTGSTGYAMSAGGSIMEPRLEAFQIVPIAPFMMNMRPYIIPDSYVIAIRLAGKTDKGVLVLDGSIVKKIEKGDDILITKARRRAKFIKFDTPFYQKYKEKIARMNTDKNYD